MCAVCGVLVMALPIPIVVDNFADYYSEQKKLEAQELKREAHAQEDAWQERVLAAAKQGLAQTIANSHQEHTMDNENGLEQDNKEMEDNGSIKNMPEAP